MPSLKGDGDHVFFIESSISLPLSLYQSLILQYFVPCPLVLVDILIYTGSVCCFS